MGRAGRAAVIWRGRFARGSSDGYNSDCGSLGVAPPARRGSRHARHSPSSAPAWTRDIPARITQVEEEREDIRRECEDCGSNTYGERCGSCGSSRLRVVPEDEADRRAVQVARDGGGGVEGVTRDAGKLRRTCGWCGALTLALLLRTPSGRR